LCWTTLRRVWSRRPEVLVIGWHRASFRLYNITRQPACRLSALLAAAQTDERPGFVANRIAERWVWSCRREILDHVIGLNEQHLWRLIRNYVHYHHEDRVHDSLEEDAPNRRGVARKPSILATGALRRHLEVRGHLFDERSLNRCVMRIQQAWIATGNVQR
jgi:hypothetical protein